MKIREKFGTSKYRHNGSNRTIPNVRIEYMREDPIAGGNKCFHWKSTAGSGSPYACSDSIVYDSFYGEAGDSWSSLPAVITSQFPYMPLNWAKLPTSTQAGIIQFFAELDGTIAMFGLKFWRELSYGSFEWGVKPFIGELTAIFDALRNLSVDLESISYEDTLNTEISLTVPCGSSGYACEANLTQRFAGTVSLDHVDGILKAFDRLGLHPDIGTFWDLVPLSFLVDRFLPVGDLLDHLYGRGWVRTASFTGWHSKKFVGKWNSTTSSFGVNPNIPAVIYSRDFLQHAVLTVIDDEPKLEFEFPSFKSMFDAFYIFVLGARTRL